MKERSILFSALMVRALLDGSKTQTRRVMKPQPDIRNGQVWTGLMGWRPLYKELRHPSLKSLICPYGQPSDRLWVREAWRCVWSNAERKPFLQYKENGEFMEPTDGQMHNRMAKYLPDGTESTKTPYRPSIHMPRWASRITLEVTNIRVERLQDISEEDAWAEGIGEKGKPLAALFNVCMNFPKLNIARLAADAPSLFGFGDDRKTPTDYEKVTWTNGRGAYAALWESINGPGSWDSNPYVWAVTFKRV